MIKVKDKERAIRIVESFNALSVILPLYEDEARRLFRATFQVDITDIVPSFFMELSRICVNDEKKANQYFNYFKLLIDYVNKDIQEIPKPINSDDRAFLAVRQQAERLVKSWNIQEYQK